MTIQNSDEAQREGREFHLDLHSPDYRHHFEEVAAELHQRCPLAWNDAYGGHWVASGHQEVFDIARRADVVSNDHDIRNERRGYKGTTIPTMFEDVQTGFVEMDPPAQRHYRQALNPYLSPAAVQRWTPFVDEIVRACLNEKIETGRIDLVDDFANVVPAVQTLAMMGLPLADWVIYNEPAHATVYTKVGSADWPRVLELSMRSAMSLGAALNEIRESPRPGMIDALARAEIAGGTPSDEELVGVLLLLIAGGFDTTTALTAHSLEWLSGHPEERARLSRDRDTLLDSATEEFLRFYTPAPGNARTVSADCELAGVRFREGERIWLSWAMANRDPDVFPDPNRVELARPSNRHSSFGLGIHRCIGSNLARMTFKRMVVQILDRIPDYHCDPAEAVHYENIGVIQGVRHLPATFTPGTRIGPGLEETLVALQKLCDSERLAEPVGKQADRG